MTRHAVLSPSSAERWVHCPGSVVLSAGIVDESSDYADEGTAAHEVAAWCLVEGTDASRYVGRPVAVRDKQVEVTDEMAIAVQMYVDTVRDYATGAELLVEQRVPIEHITGEAGACGTADALVFRDGELQVHDLKFGRGVKVDAEENLQLVLYALGALREYEALFGPFGHVRLVIHQPRLVHLSEWAVAVDDLRFFAEQLAGGAENVRRANEASADETGLYLHPSEKACRWCRAKAVCPALAGFVENKVRAELTDVAAAQQPPEVPKAAEHLSTAMRAVDLIEDWCRAVRAEVERVLFAGGAVDGFKLVEGRKGSREWADAEQAEALLRKTFRLPMEQAYKLTLISPTQAEKLLAKESPRRWHKLQPLIRQRAGQPSVAPADDPRAPWTPPDAAQDFADESAAGLL